MNPGTLKTRLAAGAVLVGALFAGLAHSLAQQPAGGPARLALVIGEAAYKSGPLSSAANDAGLIADTLQLAGFDVTGAADLDEDGLRRSLREFVDKAAAAGPEATVFIYLAGRGLQYEGENYFAPVEATVARAANAPLEAVRLSDYLQPLAQMPLRSRIIVLDAARINSFAPGPQGLAGGLALVEPDNGELIAYNAAPDTVAPVETTPYGVYAQALNEMLREGGLPVDEAFARARLRVSEVTKGAQVPWDESKLAPSPVLFARAPGSPPPVVALETQANMRARPIRDYPVDQAFAAALEQDTISAYFDFLNAYPNSAYANRVRAMLAVRREALTWRRAWRANTPSAYWTYLQRYPRGPHGEDARRRLATLSAALMPPPQYTPYEFDVPPPMDTEYVYFDRPYVVFDDNDYGPPPPMGYLLPERRDWMDRAPPPPPERGLLPLPLIAAPLLFAIPAIRHGLFHAPAAVQAQQPAANEYYGNHYGKPQAQPGGNAPAQPGGPAPANAPQQQQQSQPGAPGAPKPNGAPLPHAAPTAQQPQPKALPVAPQAPSPVVAPAQVAPPKPQAAPPPAPKAPPASPAEKLHVAPPPAEKAHAAPPPAPKPEIAPPKQVAPPRQVEPLQRAEPPHPAPALRQEAPARQPPPPHVEPPHPAPVHVAPPPPPPPAPRAEPPKPAPPPPHEHPRCGAPGEPPCH